MSRRARRFSTTSSRRKWSHRKRTAGVFAKTSEVRTQLDLLRQQVLVQAIVQDHLKTHPIKDEEMLTEYNKAKASRGDKEYKARHILVDKDSEANEIIAQLKKGTKFEDLAKQSKDPGSKDKGGDLDWNTPSTFVKPFADALSKLEKGKYTETPVQTQFGWHVIQLDDVRSMQFPAFDTVKQQLLSRMQSRKCRSSSASCVRKPRSSSQPTHVRALRNIRIHGLSSPQPCGCQDCCTVRKPRSGWASIG